MGKSVSQRVYFLVLLVRADVSPSVIRATWNVHEVDRLILQVYEQPKVLAGGGRRDEDSLRDADQRHAGFTRNRNPVDMSRASWLLRAGQPAAHDFASSCAGSNGGDNKTENGLAPDLGPAYCRAAMLVSESINLYLRALGALSAAICCSPEDPVIWP
ncbi:Hypothetical Protein FCC1311_100952, partial [Hondaea fermentalgiana]